MAVGQQVLSGVAALDVVHALEQDLTSTVADEGTVHVRKLRAVLALQPRTGPTRRSSQARTPSPGCFAS